MRQRAIIDGIARPLLVGHVRLQFDDLRQKWALLAPEKVMWPDDISLEILKRCTGTATTDEIIGALSADYAAPEDRIRQDVTKFLQDWADKRIITTREG